jgi:hypothetical protein
MALYMAGYISVLFQPEDIYLTVNDVCIAGVYHHHLTVVNIIARQAVTSDLQ